MGNLFDIGKRLREERERLGLNQSTFAEYASVTRKTLFGYENGDRAPDATALAVWATVGVDVLYVVTGQRNAPVQPALKPEHRTLIEHYDGSSPGDQAAIRQLARSVTHKGNDSHPPVPRRRAAGGGK